MGTNYYAVRNRPTTNDPIHIGKSSIGWMFNFQSQNLPYNNPPVIWNSYRQVYEWLKKYTVDSTDYVIMDEYDEILSLDEFCKIVNEKQSDEFCYSNPDNFSYCRNVDGYRFSDREFS